MVQKQQQVHLWTGQNESFGVLDFILRLCFDLHAEKTENKWNWIHPATNISLPYPEFGFTYFSQ